MLSAKMLVIMRVELFWTLCVLLKGGEYVERAGEFRGLEDYNISAIKYLSDGAFMINCNINCVYGID